MSKSDVEAEVTARLEVVAEERRRLSYELSRVREQMDAADAEEFGLRRFLAVLRGEDVSAVRRRIGTSRAEMMDRDRALMDRRMREQQMARLAHERSELEAGRQTPAAAPVEHATPQRKLNRADAIEELLLVAERPLDRREILSLLIQQGRQEETLDGVSATLSHLKRGKRLISIDGKWIAPARYAQLQEAEKAQQEAPVDDDEDQLAAQIASETRQAIANVATGNLGGAPD